MIQTTFKQYLIERANYPLQWKEGKGSDFEWSTASYIAPSGDEVLIKWYFNDDNSDIGWAWELDILINGHFEVNKDHPPKDVISLISAALQAIDEFVLKTQPATIVFQAHNKHLCKMVAKRLSANYVVQTINNPGLTYVLTHK